MPDEQLAEPVEQPHEPATEPSNNKKKLIVAGLAVFLPLLTGLTFALYKAEKPSKVATPQPVTENKDASTQKTVDLTKLPLGDNQYASSAQKGKIFSCQTTYNNNSAGAGTKGPWIGTSTWDSTRKIKIAGDVAPPNATFNNTAASKRILSGNGLPINHNYGVFPVAKNDLAYQYDRNPNSIKAQSLSISLPLEPVETNPSCMGGEAGIALSGVPVFNGFDAGGRDAQAWELQDKCDGHPQVSGQYHYHGASNCIPEIKQVHALAGHAYDGFGLYSLYGEDGKELSSKDLDECHGHKHEITWNGNKKAIYHYHFTRDFPYSVACFKGSQVYRPQPAGGQPGGMTMPPPRP